MSRCCFEGPFPLPYGEGLRGWSFFRQPREGKIMFKLICLLALASILSTSAALAAITIETVPVGNPGNAADTATAKPLRLGGLHLQHRQVRGDGRAVHGVPQRRGRRRTPTGCTTRTCGRPTYGCRITAERHRRAATPTAWRPTSSNRPVNYVSWGDACRFANWLHNGQPTGAQDLATTEDGAYYLNGATSDAAPTGRQPQGGLEVGDDQRGRVVQGGVLQERRRRRGDYWDYPTSSNTAPGRDMADVSGQQRQLLHGTVRTPSTRHVLHDGGGRVPELRQPVRHVRPGRQRVGVERGDLYGSYRGLRGGSFQPISDLRASYRSGYGYPTGEDYDLGFRVSEVPEPAFLGILALPLLAQRRRN